MIALQEAPTDIGDYHQRTKHSPGRYAQGPSFLDWESQPSPFRRFIGARLFDLPFRAAAPTPPFSQRAPTPAPLNRDALGLFCELAFGLSAWKNYEGATWALRNNPSSGNLHPTETYLLLGAVPGLADAAALYHYAPQEHALEERARCAASDALPRGGFLLGLSGVLWRESWKYGERAFRYCQLDAGHALGAAAAAAAALGWRAHLLAEPGDDDIAALLGLDRADAGFRREKEHPDALLWIALDEAPPPALDLSALLQIPRTFQGVANRLSEDPGGWPIVDLAAHLCRKPRSLALAPIATRAASFPVEAPPESGNVIRNRRSAQRMDGRAVMPRGAFVATLKATLPGAEPLLSAFTYPPRLALLLFVHRVEGVAPGLYLLSRDPDLSSILRAAMAPDHDFAPVTIDGLELLRLSEGAVEPTATKSSCLQAIAGKGCFSLAMIADFDRALVAEGPFGYRLLHWEAGLIGQALYLFATASGLAGTGIGCFFDDEIHALLGLPLELDAIPGRLSFHHRRGGRRPAIADAAALPRDIARTALKIEIDRPHVEALIERFPQKAPLAAQLRFGEKVEVDLRRLDAAEFDFLQDLYRQSGPALQTQAAQLATLRNALSSGGRRFEAGELEEALPALIRHMMEQPLRGWLFSAAVSTKALPYVVTQFDYVPTSNDEAGKILVEMKANVKGSLQASVLRISAGDVAGRTISEILAAKGFLRETPALIEAFDAASETYFEWRGRYGAQFSGKGLGFHAEDPNSTHRDTDWARKDVVVLSTSGGGARLVNDEGVLTSRNLTLEAPGDMLGQYPAQGQEERPFRRRGRGRGAARTDASRASSRRCRCIPTC